MKILVTGAGGQLGYDVVRELNRLGIECCGTDLQDFDITNLTAVRNFITKYKPSAVIHCSAYTAVDKAEDEPSICYKVNAIGTENIAMICREINAKMLYISTDYVFEGTGEKCYEPDDKPAPQNVYGQTKLAGELAVQKILDRYFIVRISWVFGINGNNFVKTMLRVGKEKKEISVVVDQVGSPTYTSDLAILLCDIIQTEKYGIYHATNEGTCSWAEFAEKIFWLAGMNVKVKPIKTEEYPTKAKRPHNSRMSKEKLLQQGFNKLPDWENALERYFIELEHFDDIIITNIREKLEK